MTNSPVVLPTPDQVIASVVLVCLNKPVVTNIYRSLIEEAIVSAGLDESWCSADYAGWDFQQKDGTRLEVKQSAAKTVLGTLSPRSVKATIRHR